MLHHIIVGLVCHCLDGLLLALVEFIGVRGLNSKVGRLGERRVVVVLELVLHLLVRRVDRPALKKGGVGLWVLHGTS